MLAEFLEKGAISKEQCEKSLEDVLKEEMFGCHPCENTRSIRFATKELTDKIIPALGVTPVMVKLVGVEM